MSATLLAFDLGASSGRAILGRFRDGRLSIDELHRFRNDPIAYNGELHWNLPALWSEMQTALDRLATHGVERLDSLGVDTWGVDYALLGEHGALLENPYHYRDARTDGLMEEVTRRLSRERIYSVTGIQFMPINTLYQLYAAARRTPNLLTTAEALVTIPDLLNYWLTGKVACEYTNASTTQFLDSKTRCWAATLLRDLDIPTHFLSPIVAPGTVLGGLLPDIARRPALAVTAVVAPACHDTGSAVAAVRAGGKTAFLSSGTWSLLGTEVTTPIATPEALRLNFTNEGGVCGTVRLLKNITGLWLLEGCRKDWERQGQAMEWPALLAAAASVPPFRHVIDPDDPCFVRPEAMTEAINAYCHRTDQPAPATPGAFFRTVLESLTLKYRLVLEELESLTATRFDVIRVIGGGSQNDLLNQFTADATGRVVLAGPAEATALGNLVMQMVGMGMVASLDEARELIERSFPPRRFEPADTAKWEGAYSKLQSYCGGVCRA